MEESTGDGENDRDEITYEKLAINIIRYLDIHDFSVIDRMTIKEYSMLMEGQRLRSIDELEKIHLLAYKMQVVKNKKKQGDKFVSAYPAFVDFFDKKLLEQGVSSKAMDVSEDELEMYKLLSK